MSGVDYRLSRELSIRARELVLAARGDDDLAEALVRVLGGELVELQERMRCWGLAGCDAGFARRLLRALGFGDVAADFSDSEVERFLSVLPKLRSVAGRPDAVAETIGGFLGAPVACRSASVRQHELTDDQFSQLGGRYATLDGGWHLGSEIRERLTGVDVVIGPLSRVEADRLVASDWLRRGGRRLRPGAKLRAVADCLVPLQIEAHWVVWLHQRRDEWRLGVPGYSELGASTRACR